MKAIFTLLEIQEYYDEYQQYLKRSSYYTDAPMSFSEYIKDSEEEIESVNNETKNNMIEQYYQMINDPSL